MKKILLLVLLTAVLLTGCAGTAPVMDKTPTLTPLADGPIAPPSATTTPTLDPNAPPDMWIDTLMLGDNPHDAGGQAVVLTLQPNVDAPNTNVTITLPSDAVMLTGSQAWAGDLKAGQALYLNLTFQIDTLSKPGEIKIESISYPKDKPKFEKVYKLYVRPAAGGKLEFSKKPFTN